MRHVSHQMMNTDLYREGEHSVTCPECDAAFEVMTRARYSFTSPSLKQQGSLVSDLATRLICNCCGERGTIGASIETPEEPILYAVTAKCYGGPEACQSGWHLEPEAAIKQWESLWKDREDDPS